MHTISIAIGGAANDGASVDLPDDQALPMYSKLKDVLLGGSAAGRRPVGRRKPQAAETNGSGNEIASEPAHEDL